MTLSAKGERLNTEMQTLWANRWVKLNNMWKDPDTGRCHSREQALKILTSKHRKAWIREITAEDSARRNALQEHADTAN
jgi:hypothetical protein